MTKLDNQTAFDRALAHMMRQTSQASVADGSCVYYNPADGNTCGVGCLLPVELAKQLSAAEFVNKDGGSWGLVVEYSTAHEGDNYYYSEQRDADPIAVAAVEALEGVSDRLLNEIQRVHDARKTEARTDDDKLDILQEMKALAKRHGLEYR